MSVLGLTLLASALTTPTPARAQVSAEESARRLKPAAGLEATLWASEPMLVNPTNIDIDSRGRVWVTEGLNYRLTRGGNARFHRDRGRGQDQDPRGHRRRRQGRQGDRLRRQDLPRADGHRRRGALRQGRQVHRAAASSWATAPTCSCSRTPTATTRPTSAIRSSPASAGSTPTTACTAWSWASTASSTSPTATAAARCRRTSPSGQQNFDVIDKSGRHVSSDQLANTLRVNRDGTQFEVICDRQRNNYETCLNSFGNIFTSDNDDDGNRGCRVIWAMDGGHYGYHTPGSPRHWGEDVPGQRSQARRHRQRQPLRHHGLRGIVYCPRSIAAASSRSTPAPARSTSSRSPARGPAFRTEYKVLLSSDDPWFRPDRRLRRARRLGLRGRLVRRGRRRPRLQRPDDRPDLPRRAEGAQGPSR